MRKQDARPVRLSRREAIRLLGVGAGLGFGTVMRGEAGVPAAAWQAVAQPATKLAFPKDAIIRTLLKDVPPDTLGTGATLFHEHLSLGGRKEVAWMVDEIQAAGKSGVSCLVDAGTRRRDERLMEDLRQIAAQSDVHIVLSGGYYQDVSVGVGRYPPQVVQLTEDQLVDELARDAKAQRWGAFGEIASSPEMQPEERKVHRAIGKAHLRTGIPIFTHTPHAGCPTCALEQLEIYESLGVDPRHLCIGHLSDFRDDPRAVVHKAIARRGAFLGFDTIRPESPSRPVSMERAAAMVVAVIAAGYEDHVLLSHDGLVDETWFSHNGGAGYAMLLIFFVPKLRDAGVKEATLHKILVDNPRRFLAFVPKSAS